MTLSTPGKKYKKEYDEVEIKWLNKIAKWKWSGKYKCRACRNINFFEGKTPASRKCAKCKHEESATAHTPFHGQRLSIGDVLMILACLVDTYEEFHHLIDSSDYLTDRSGQANFRLRNADCRASSITIAKKLGMHQRTVYLFLSRFMDSIPPEVKGRSNIPAQWFRGVSGDIERYKRLYWLIERCGAADGIVEYLVTHTSKVEDEDED